MRPTFENEPVTDFTLEANVSAFRAALADVKGRLGGKYPMIVDGMPTEVATEFTSTSPANPDLVIGRFPQGDALVATRAIEAADRAFTSWSRVPAEERARYLVSTAGQIRRRRFELAAWMVYEVGKSWAEADGEVAECVDIMEYYGYQTLEFAGSKTDKLGKLADEDTDFFYIPLGVGVIISPWNFPMALTFGMAGAAIACGNTVVIKPASTSPASVHRFAEIFMDLGLPPGVMNVITGPGTVLGDVLIDHPRTRFIGFTGSMEVGTRIHERAAKVQPGQSWLKRTILEMGGKNAVIVDREADVNAAVEGVVASAFSYQGQKCSAGSRAIIDESIYDDFVGRLVQRTRKLHVGDPIDPRVEVGPVIDEHAFQSILKFIEVGKTEGKLLIGGERVGDKGYFIQPTIFGDLDPKATIAQEEIFGPVLACIRAKNFDEALAIANGTRYGLTGSVFSQNRRKLEQARHKFHTGNLYFNRKSTGALMGVHPFGGFNMSGTDSKAGGPDYLLHFLQGKSIGDKLR